MRTALIVDSINLSKRNEDGVLSRNKRYIVFPEGSTLSIAICMTAQVLGPANIFTEGLNWGISYELPNDSSEFREYFFPKKVMQRRHRRDLYQKMELIMNSMGYDGRACIFKALCETSRRLMSNGNGIIEELLKIVFKFPLQRLLHSEPEEHRLYHWASRMGRDSNQECEDMFPGCSFSLIDMALGGYSNIEDDGYPPGNT
ncbi:DM4/DM12 family [Popillia japonica]|uniref:DM4/DM12 family n=1 Tax=Popillia japonica TaxID=7064 RepID=A0AAW1IWZ1_POPJA